MQNILFLYQTTDCIADCCFKYLLKLLIIYSSNHCNPAYGLFHCQKTKLSGSLCRAERIQLCNSGSRFYVNHKNMHRQFQYSHTKRYRLHLGIIFYCSCSFIAFFPKTLYNNPDNIPGTIFIVLTMFVAYIVVLRYLESET